MQKTMSARLALAAASMGILASGAAATPTRTAAAPRPRARARPLYRTQPKGSGTRKYPEQSDRQALRGQRRAQGGPGLTQMRSGAWVPRNLVESA